MNSIAICPLSGQEAGSFVKYQTPYSVWFSCDYFDETYKVGIRLFDGSLRFEHNSP